MCLLAPYAHITKEHGAKSPRSSDLPSAIARVSSAYRLSARGECQAQHGTDTSTLAGHGLL